MKILKHFFCLGLLWILTLSLGFAQDFRKDFTAGIVSVDSAKRVLLGKIFVKNNMLRLEYTAGPEPVIMIIRFDKKLIWSLLSEKYYLEVPITFNPIFPQTDPRQKYTSQDLGEGVVLGFKCKIIQYVYDDPLLGLAKVWLSEELSFPLRTEIRDSVGNLKETTELQNIKIENQPESLFSVPAGYESLDFRF